MRTVYICFIVILSSLLFSFCHEQNTNKSLSLDQNLNIHKLLIKVPVELVVQQGEVASIHIDFKDGYQDKIGLDTSRAPLIIIDKIDGQSKLVQDGASPYLAKIILTVNRDFTDLESSAGSDISSQGPIQASFYRINLKSDTKLHHFDAIADNISLQVFDSAQLRNTYFQAPKIQILGNIFAKISQSSFKVNNLSVEAHQMSNMELDLLSIDSLNIQLGEISKLKLLAGPNHTQGLNLNFVIDGLSRLDASQIPFKSSQIMSLDGITKAEVDIEHPAKQVCASSQEGYYSNKMSRLINLYKKK